jgi:hypothetical protein
MSSFQLSPTSDVFDVNTPSGNSPVTVSVSISSRNTNEMNTLSPITVSLNTPATNSPSNNSDNIDTPSYVPSKHRPKCKNNLNFKRKLLYTLYAVILFIIVSLPETYEKTNELFSTNEFLKETFHLDVLGNKGPTINGVLLHSVVFGIAIYLLMLILH